MNSRVKEMIAVCTLAAVLIVILIGLFRAEILHGSDEQQILGLISHAFDIIIGCFVGIAVGRATGGKD